MEEPKKGVNKMELSKEARELQRQYYREYARTHREQKNEAQRRYWERRAQELRESKGSNTPTSK